LASEGARQNLSIGPRLKGRQRCIFGVFAREAEDLVLPLVHIRMTEQPAPALATELMAERAVMDEEEERG
jgi:hypothetical protein